MPKIGKVLQCKCVKGNKENLYIVRVMRSDTIVEHVPHEESHVV